MEFKDNLAKILDQKNMRQADLCRLTGIERTCINKYLTGKIISPRPKHLHKIASILNVSEGYLLGYEDNSSITPCERSFAVTLQFPQNVEIQSKVQAVSEHEAIGKVLEIIPTATYENIIEIKEDI